MKNPINQLFRKLFKPGMNIQYWLYTKLKIRKALGYKTFKINHSTISTCDDKITVGKEYQYREGSYVERVIIKNIDFNNYFIVLKVFFIDENRTITCDHLLSNCSYSGMWCICDKGHYDIEASRKKRNKPIDQSLLDSIPVIYI